MRFKKPGADNGMFGLKPDVLMRTKENPNMKIDWDTFDKIDRTKAQIASVKDIVEVQSSKQSYNCKRETRHFKYMYNLYRNSWKD